MERKTINLALQGGGALGAYTWGVLDRILEDDRLEIEAVSGASAGAMNAVVMAEGLVEGGEPGAREALRKFWTGIAKAGQYSPFRASPLKALMRQTLGDEVGGQMSDMMMAPMKAWMAAWGQFASPYQSALSTNPLKEVLEELVDFDRVRACNQVQLYVSATNVETGRVRVFTNQEMTADCVMASACLPTLFRSVKINEDFYWDGGFMGNPPLFPLFTSQRTRDILIVQLNPIERPGEPRAPDQISRRMNEINFNSTLMRELQAIDFVSRLVKEDRLDQSRYREMLIHFVSDDTALVALDPGSKLDTDMIFFEKLFEIGRMACDQFLDNHFDDIGARSTVDLRRMFKGEVGPIASAPAGHRRAKA
jgi:NTE family protein